jgi:hypothetical protein
VLKDGSGNVVGPFISSTEVYRADLGCSLLVVAVGGNPATVQLQGQGASPGQLLFTTNNCTGRIYTSNPTVQLTCRTFQFSILLAQKPGLSRPEEAPSFTAPAYYRMRRPLARVSIVALSTYTFSGCAALTANTTDAFELEEISPPPAFVQPLTFDYL